MELYRYSAGDTRVLVSIPHAGTFVPPELAARMTPAARMLADTDWHVDRLYEFLAPLGVTTLIATHSRYVVDLNRPADGTPLYPGLNETGVCPGETFGGQPVWQPGHAPDAGEVARRIGQYWRPYHERLHRELAALKARHGSVVLWDAHSIRSRVPRLFEGELPVFNFGTNGGSSCSAGLATELLRHALACSGQSAVLDGRFKGGYITRACGNPRDGVHAVQLELAQRCYMDEATAEYLPLRARGMSAILTSLIGIALREVLP
jgi:N-formylglutamate deformylase